MNDNNYMKIIYGNSPDTFLKSNICLVINNIPLYLFILHEETPIPHFHLINIDKCINIAIRLDISDYYHYRGTSNIIIDEHAKQGINKWIYEKFTDQFGNEQSNWEYLKTMFMFINSNFDEDSFIRTGIDKDFDWEQYFPEGFSGPDYRRLP